MNLSMNQKLYSILGVFVVIGTLIAGFGIYELSSVNTQLNRIAN